MTVLANLVGVSVAVFFYGHLIIDRHSRGRCVRYSNHFNHWGWIALRRTVLIVGLDYQGVVSPTGHPNFDAQYVPVVDVLRVTRCGAEHHFICRLYATESLVPQVKNFFPSCRTFSLRRVRTHQQRLQAGFLMSCLILRVDQRT